MYHLVSFEMLLRKMLVNGRRILLQPMMTKEWGEGEGGLKKQGSNL